MVLASVAHNMIDDDNENNSKTNKNNSNINNSNINTGRSSIFIYFLELVIVFISFYFYFSRNFGPDCSDVGILQQILEFFFACCCHICYIAYSLVVGSCTGGSIMKGGSRGRR